MPYNSRSSLTLKVSKEEKIHYLSGQGWVIFSGKISIQICLHGLLEAHCEYRERRTKIRRDQGKDFKPSEKL